VPVECRAFLEYLFTARRRFRKLWQEYCVAGEVSPDRVRELSGLTGISFSHIMTELRAVRHFGLLLERISFYAMCRDQWPDLLRLAPMEYVVREMQADFRNQTRPAVRARRVDRTQYETVGVSAIRNGAESARVRRPLGVDSPVRVQASELITNAPASRHGS
jgi:hypothetical protein